ncbi:MarR family winged helix-turn-helix transcriptional regulator [Streptomyces sp. NPDC051569]|uniref:MarR family winged helix-turn-helix transcriptional regulator n=1 Tax=Streptomyces sp. NPDC051569 TaxID=3365661 RepID=UPI00379DAB43
MPGSAEVNAEVPEVSPLLERVPAQGDPLSRPLSAVEREVWLGFLCTHVRLLRTLDKELLAAEGLATSSYEVLLAIAEAPEGRMRMKDIAASLLISRSGLTRIVDDLEGQGHVERLKCPGDARGLDAVLTPSGREAYLRARTVHLASLRRQFLGKLSEEQLRTLAEIWRAVDLSESADD